MAVNEAMAMATSNEEMLRVLRVGRQISVLELREILRKVVQGMGICMTVP